MHQGAADEGLRPDLPTAAEREEIKALHTEVYDTGDAAMATRPAYPLGGSFRANSMLQGPRPHNQYALAGLSDLGGGIFG